MWVESRHANEGTRIKTHWLVGPQLREQLPVVLDTRVPQNPHQVAGSPVLLPVRARRLRPAISEAPAGGACLPTTESARGLSGTCACRNREHYARFRRPGRRCTSRKTFPCAAEQTRAHVRPSRYRLPGRYHSRRRGCSGIRLASQRYTITVPTPARGRLATGPSDV